METKRLQDVKSEFTEKVKIARYNVRSYVCVYNLVDAYKMSRAINAVCLLNQYVLQISNVNGLQ